MDAEQFWAIVDAARQEVGPWPEDLDQDWADALYIRLLDLPPDDILDFDRTLTALRHGAERPEMAAAIQLVVRPATANERSSPRFVSFPYKFQCFATCLVMLGRDTYERAVADRTRWPTTR